MSELNKNDVVVGLVKEGIYTREEIREKADCNSSVLASYFSGMRNAAKWAPESAICPMEKEVDGKKVIVAVTFAEYEADKAERATSSGTSRSAKTPKERLALARKRISRLEAAVANSKDKHEATPDDRVLELKFKKAEIELELNQLEIGKLEEEVGPEEENPDVTELVEEDAEFGDFPTEAEPEEVNGVSENPYDPDSFPELKADEFSGEFDDI